jgi:superfamily II DNA or RNA helicase
MSESKNEYIYYPSEDSDSYSDILNKYEFTSNDSKSKKNYIYQEPNQLLLRNYISIPTMYENVLLYHGLGTGKCMKHDTPILMFDGSIKKIQDIKIGDLIMGDDSTPRQVLSLARGEDEMFDIIPIKGEKYTVNSEHILCLKADNFPKLDHIEKRNVFRVEWLQNNKFNLRHFFYKNDDNIDKNYKKIVAQKFIESINTEQVLEISVTDYLKLSKNKKELLKGYKTAIEFPEKKLDNDPYLLGYFLGNKKKNNVISDNYPIINLLNQYNLLDAKYIPYIYKCNSKEIRIKLIAGIIDSCGIYKNGSFQIRQPIKNKKLITDIIYLSRSLGFACDKKSLNNSNGKNIKLIIRGAGLENIPTLLPQNKVIQKQKGDVLLYNIKVVPVGRDKYYGFTLDGNCRYVIGDFSVTHNTCTSITIAEGFKEYLANMDRKILVLVKNKNIQRNFMNELASKCTHDSYLTEEQRNLYFETNVSTDLSEIKREIINKLHRTIYKSYQFLTYGTFVNRVLGVKEFEKDEFGRNTSKLIKKDGKVQRRFITEPLKNLNNTVIIVDEAHNLTNNDTYIALKQVLSNSYNYRLILLTATPMYDNPKEIFEIANLLNSNNQEYQLPIRNDLFKPSNGDNKVLVTREQSSMINSKILKGGIIKITDDGLSELSKVLTGKVSFIKQNTTTNPKKIMMGKDLIPNRIGTTKVVYCQMSKNQYLAYLNALKTDINRDINLDISAIIQNIESLENTNEDISVSKTGSLYKNSSDASTMTYPNGLYGKEGFLSIFKKVKSGKYITETPEIMTTDLQNYSTKLWKLLENVKLSPGNVFIFSNYVSFGGTSLLKILFSLNGYSEFKSGRSPEYKSFVIFDESINIETREKYRRIFNSPENKEGKLIKILIGSPVISEGITLKNVRQVHILEPSWNRSRVNQIIGRAIRNNSHIDLNIEDRTVQIYQYVSVFYTKREMEGDLRTENLSKFFIDREKYILSEEKDRSNKVVERMLKEISFDCELMSKRNMSPQDDEINGSPECDYTNCDYQCKLKHKNDSSDVDKSTYNLHISTFDKFDIYYILSILRQLFQKYFVWSLNDIVSIIRDNEVNISKEAIYTTLAYVTENKISFVDMYNRDGFIINRDEYYIFNNDDIDVDSSIYSKILDFSVDRTKYTLNDFTKMKIDTDLFEKEKEEIPKEATTEQKLTEEDIEYNDNIIANEKVFGTYRQRGTIKQPYGKFDGKFRIIDIRKIEIDEDADKRKNISGMWIGSYKKPQLLDIASFLNIQTKVGLEEYDKEQLGKLIEKHLTSNNLILR